MSYYHECPECHAALDPGERCDCQQVRSCCPFFSDRVDFKGVSSIVCIEALKARVQAEHDTREARDQHYRTFCCGRFEACRFYSFMNSFKGKDEGK